MPEGGEILRIAVVDGYSTGRVLVQKLDEAGVRLVHVRSLPESHPYFLKGFESHRYEQDLGYCDDVGMLAKHLSVLGVARVVAGTESGVPLAEALNGVLGTPGNDPDKAPASCDKAFMSELIAAAGIAAPRGGAFSCADEAVAWCRAQAQGAVVVKPIDSAGSDHVYFADTEAEIRSAVGKVLGSRNIYGGRNEGVLVQQRVTGTEYFVDTVSHLGRHKVAETWRYSKRLGDDGIPLYDFQEPVAPSAREWRTLRSFVLRVLDALGVRSSPAHTEVMLTEHGPVLIETGARLGGGTLPDVVEAHCGISQTSLFVHTLMDSATLSAFDESTVRGAGRLRFIDLCNQRAGTVTSQEFRHRIGALPTFVAISTGITAGTVLPTTTSLLDSPGFVYLSGAPGDVERDYLALREMEAAGLYTA